MPRGVHFSIEETAATSLRNAGDDEELVAVVEEEIEEAWEHAYESDKAWDALHRCLTDGTLSLAGGDPPLSYCFPGGTPLNQGGDYYVLLLDPPQVKETAEALARVDKQWLRERYFSLDFVDYQDEKSEEDFEYTWTWFEGLPACFGEAAEQNRYVIFTVDQ